MVEKSQGMNAVHAKPKCFSNAVEDRKHPPFFLLPSWVSSHMLNHKRPAVLYPHQCNTGYSIHVDAAYAKSSILAI
jgi:hypothetical protein